MRADDYTKGKAVKYLVGRDCFEITKRTKLGAEINEDSDPINKRNLSTS
jgi:hypothetical protein